jgi:hypothetical protein
MPESPKADANIVRAAPTKRFFISVLVKDIYMMDAIVELVDNSIDSARSKFGTTSLRGIFIDIKYDQYQFQIADNAGGIPIEQAKNYAFRFGRPDDAPKTPGTVGEFGVGMKRALFKLGRHFLIESRTKTDAFKITLDVDEWEAIKEDDPNAWNFRFSETGRNSKPDETGTNITVTKLYDYAIEDFKSTNFGSRLSTQLRETHAETLAAGLQITVNGTHVNADSATLLASQDLEPIAQDITLDILGKQVNVKLLAGVGEPKLADAGWYVFCNGRLIERADKTEKTGWNSALDGEQTPKPHWQFRRFRGFVFFESSATDVLPWNTTKTSLDVESPAYRRVRPDMSSALRQVVEFLNALDGETGQPGPLTAIVESARQLRLLEIPARTSFEWSRNAVPKETKQARINYIKEQEIVQQVKERLQVKSNKEVGEKTFDYYVDAEGLSGE